MALASLDELKTAVSGWATRTDSAFTARLPDFIRLAEERIWQRVRVSDMVTLPEVLTIPAGLFYADLPDGFLAFRSIGAIAPNKNMDFIPADRLYALPTPGDGSVYSIEGRRFLYGQTPSADLAITVRYYKAPDLLTDATSTNWLLEKAPSVYLYAALLEYYVFAKNAAKVGEYGKLFDDAVQRLESADQAAMISGSTLRMRRP